MFIRLAQQHRQFVRDLVMTLKALAIALENKGYLASCYTCGGEMNSASFMVSLKDEHLIRFWFLTMELPGQKCVTTANS